VISGVKAKAGDVANTYDQTAAELKEGEGKARQERQQNAYDVFTTAATEKTNRLNQADTEVARKNALNKNKIGGARASYGDVLGDKDGADLLALNEIINGGDLSLDRTFKEGSTPYVPISEQLPNVPTPKLGAGLPDVQLPDGGTRSVDSILRSSPTLPAPQGAPPAIGGILDQGAGALPSLPSGLSNPAIGGNPLGIVTGSSPGGFPVNDGIDIGYGASKPGANPIIVPTGSSPGGFPVDDGLSSVSGIPPLKPLATPTIPLQGASNPLYDAANAIAGGASKAPVTPDPLGPLDPWISTVPASTIFNAPISSPAPIVSPVVSAPVADPWISTVPASTIFNAPVSSPISSSPSPSGAVSNPLPSLPSPSVLTPQAPIVTPIPASVPAAPAPVSGPVSAIPKVTTQAATPVASSPLVNPAITGIPSLKKPTTSIGRYF